MRGARDLAHGWQWPWGGGHLTCLVLLPVPCVPVAHERAGVVLIQVQLGQHSLPGVEGRGTERGRRAHTSHQGS